MNKLIYSLSEKRYKKMKIEDILNYIKESDYEKNVAGFEIASYELESIKCCANFCKENNLIFKCHYPGEKYDFEYTKKYLYTINEISKELGYRVNIVFHSLNHFKDLDLSINETLDYINDILEYVKENNLQVYVSLENLNTLNGQKRINVDNIDKILNVFNILNFTYDAGHDIYDNIIPSNLSKIQIEKINNVHIHSIKNEEDHHVIYETVDDIEQIRKIVRNLKDIGYTGDYVLEYGYDYLIGESDEEKIKSYIKSFEIMQKILKNS